MRYDCGITVRFEEDDMDKMGLLAGDKKPYSSKGQFIREAVKEKLKKEASKADGRP
jgi:Arc/MetJ-type ribon-helix-helix transcriptional regulator